MLERLRVRNYRSLRDASIEFGQLTVVTGPNGSGKSNLYRSLELLQAAAVGQFSQALLTEGGMPSALWAGDRGKGPVRMNLTAQWSDLTHTLEAGLVAVEPGNPFVLDPEIKEEYVFLGRARTKASTVADRSAMTATVVTADGEKRRLSSLNPAESILDQVGEPGLYPELAVLGRRMRGWGSITSSTLDGRARFAGHNRACAPMRWRPTDLISEQRSPPCSSEATIVHCWKQSMLHAPDIPWWWTERPAPSALGWCRLVCGARSVARSFPTVSSGSCVWRPPCCPAALPELLVLNESETSLHPSAVAALAPLILEASKFSQLWVTTHDETLRDLLAPHSTVSTLTLVGGATSVTLDE